MAIFHLSAHVVKRSAGRSATAAAAYRAGAEIADERTGQRFDYSRRFGVLSAEIMAPTDAPAWMHDRAQLWNAVEKIEKRKDAQLARDIEISLPHELDRMQQIELVRAFVAEQFVAQGMIADIAFHAPGKRGDNRNYHAHILLTMRELLGDGFGNKARGWNETEQLEHWREAWANHVNSALAREGIAARVDHRSLAAQGIDREPGTHQGPAVAEMTARGEATDCAATAAVIANEGV
jgi:ATP-dependent exoDNAse (exonuclease V) alpha subunit